MRRCVDLDIAIFINAGVPGPRIRMETQNVELIDEVCWFFPETARRAAPWRGAVDRSGGQADAEMAEPLLFDQRLRAKHYPNDIIAFANSRGADKIIYAGYYPSGLTLDRIFAEMRNVPFKDHVWPKFLRENALKVL